MDLEVSTDSKKNASHFNIKLRNYKNEYENLKSRFNKIQENYINKKGQNALGLAGFEDEMTNKKAQKQKLIEHEEIAWNQNEKLQNAKRKTIEMESVSIDVMRNLDKQSDQMKIVGNKIVDLNSEIDQSQDLINRMLRRENRNKIIIILFTLSLVLILILYLFFYKFN